MMLTLDGARGEGGGQIVRTALALSVTTGTPFRIDRVRAARKKPGLLAQHLTALRAAAEISRAKVEGAEEGSSQFSFEPGRTTPGDYRFAVGTAGSATLVLQTVLPSLMIADGPSTLMLQGGTHNAWAPPFDFLDKAFLPLIRRMGARVTALLDRPGFYPAGGGEFRVKIEPAGSIKPVEILERGAIRALRARAVVSHLPADIARRELDLLVRELRLDPGDAHLEENRLSRGPGNVAMVEVESEHLTEVFTGFGRRGINARDVARELATEVKTYLETGAPVGEHLADQLMIPLALAGGGAFRTGALSRHSTTNIETIAAFMPPRLTVTERADGTLVVGR